MKRGNASRKGGLGGFGGGYRREGEMRDWDCASHGVRLKRQMIIWRVIREDQWVEGLRMIVLMD